MPMAGFQPCPQILDCVGVANTLAYYDSATITAVKSFTYSAQGDKAKAGMKQVSMGGIIQ